MKIYRSFTLVTMALLSLSLSAQEEVRSSSSIYLTVAPKADNVLSFSASAEGKKYEPEWGLDLAWINEGNLIRGLNHMGKENVAFGRSSYRVCAPLTGDTALVKAMWQGMRDRNTLFDKVNKNLPLILNCDNGYSPSTTTGTNIDEYYTKNGMANIAHWAAMLNAHVAWMTRNAKAHPVIGVSVMNEPDFNGNENELIQGTAADIRDIAKKLREDYPLFKDLVITGPNTLNNDKALSWYNTCKNYVDWGNTHQLAGSFANYVGFHEQLQKDGKVGFNDEMHNVGEAFIGLEYGMTKGIWWGFDSRARGEFCDISRKGSRLAYTENRGKWTAACVYRNDNTGAVKAFMGCSERQANTTSYQFVSLDDVVYYDGKGPLRELRIEIPGGDAGTYQTEKHRNAERVIDVTWGEDVAPGIINGDYVIMNKYSKQVVAEVSGDIRMARYSQDKSQQWTIKPVSDRVGGDFSFYDIISLNDSKRINVLNHSLESGANLMPYDAGGDINEQWYLEYAGDGCYFIRNRESALYLSAAERSLTKDNINIYQARHLTGLQESRQLWRIIPVDAECETFAPEVPKGLVATSQAASVRLQWDANTEADLEGYMILRADVQTGKWNMIARKVKTAYFIDNTCLQGHTYQYKIKAIDRSDNQSDCCEAVEAAPVGNRSLIARWQLEGNAYDSTQNMLDAVVGGAEGYSEGHTSGEKSFTLTGSGSYLQLPYEIAHTDELTIAMWVNWQDYNTRTWQRIFDFGYDTNHYMFLTPNAGSCMRFAIKNGADEQQLDCPSKLSAYVWKHVAVTFAKNKVAIYVDGAEVASTAGITISPKELHPLLNYIGRSQFYSDPYFKGYVDDICIFNYALNADEVMELKGGTIPSGISQPAVDLDSEPTVVYGLDGKKRTALQQGLNIVSKPVSGSAVKVIKK
ncbi:MAG: RICIN domain-containing protein [Prevotella sp.]|nr:RICIN domain-containing protein [Prevotella sp.]